MQLNLLEDVNEIFGYEEFFSSENIEFKWDSLSIICAITLIKEKYNLDAEPDELVKISDFINYKSYLTENGVIYE
jgi:hypothetical protein